MTVNAHAEEWQWDAIERDVVQRIRLLRAAATKTEPAQLRAKIVEDLIVPAMQLLAEFCSCVKIDHE